MTHNSHDHAPQVRGFWETPHEAELESAREKFESDAHHFVWMFRVGWAAIVSMVLATVGSFFGIWTGSTFGAAFAVFYIPACVLGICWMVAKLEDDF